jgi:hypothetical protein
MIRRNDTKVHHYLKVMETSESHPDTQTLKELHDGEITKDNEQVKRYLCKRLQNIKGRRIVGSAL